jgi:hypothetical protein
LSPFLVSLLKISLLIAGFDGIERLSVLNNPVCLSQNSLRSYIARTMPRLKVFNDVIITDEERAPSPAATPALLPCIAAVPARDRMQTLALNDPHERGREKEETETERERETDLGPRAGSAMCYPLRAKNLDREEGDSLSHTTVSSSSPHSSLILTLVLLLDLLVMPILSRWRSSALLLLEMRITRSLKSLRGSLRRWYCRTSDRSYMKR